MTAESDFMRAVGRKIRSVRMARNLTQQDVSDVTGLPRASMSKVECGDQPVRLWELVLMADLFECDLFDLLPVAGPSLTDEKIEVELIVRRANSVHCIKHTV